MPTNLQFDFSINGAGFILARDPQSKGRAWVRTGVSDSLSTQRRVVRSIYSSDEEYGGLPDELDHPEVHDDWSGGYGDYYHKKGQENHYHTGFNIDTRFPGMWFHAQQPQLLAARYASTSVNVDYIIDMPSSAVNPPAGYGHVLLIGKNNYTALLPTSMPYTAGSAFDLAPRGSLNNFGHRPAIFGSYIYVPSVDGSGFMQLDFAVNTPTFAAMPANWLAVANARLWRGYGRGQVQSCAIGADPLGTANWSATLNLGNGQMASQDAVSLEDRLFIGFPDGVYMGDQTGTFTNVATTVGASVSPDNCRDLTVHNNQVVFAVAGHVWGYAPSSGGGALRDLWPQIDVRPLATLGAVPAGTAPLVTRGAVRCLESFGRWLYAGVFNGSQSMVFCGREASGPDLPYVWHPMQLLGNAAGGTHVTKISRLHVSAVTVASDGNPIARRMWVATDATFGAQTGCTAPVYNWPIPLDDGPPFADTSFSSNPALQAMLEESQRDWDAPGTWKVWRKLEVYAESVGSLAAPLTVAAVIDGTMGAIQDGGLSNQVYFGGGGDHPGPPKDWHYFTNQNATAVGQAARLSYRSAVPLASVSPTPIYRAFIERGNVRPRTADVITAKVRIADTVQDRQGGEMRPGAQMLSDLRTFALSSNPYPLVDLVGTVLPILVIPPVEEQEYYQGGSDNPEIIATVKMAVLDASWPTANQTPINPRGG